MGDMRSPLARRRDEWFESAEGQKCLAGTATGVYLRNRLDRAFVAGAALEDVLVAALEGLTGDADRIGGDGYGMPECPWCGADGGSPEEGYRHDSDCELLKARAALALAGRGT